MRMRKSYREYVDDLLTVADRLVAELGLSKLPHFTTLEKFTLWGVRRGPRNDIIDFGPVVRKAHSVRPIGIAIGDKGYDSERNHRLLREELHTMSMIPARMQDVPL
jgi:hypothetical protein